VTWSDCNASLTQLFLPFSYRCHASALTLNWQGFFPILGAYLSLSSAFRIGFRLLCLSVALGTLAAQTPRPASSPKFTVVDPSKSGIHWVHTSCRSDLRHLPESIGPGVAFLDYDNDGWMDIFFVNSGKADFYTPDHPLKNALYRNNHDGTFTDVTDKAGVAGGGYGMGIAVGDYDNDGFPDIYVTQVGRNVLYHNNGNGTFTDVTDKAGVATKGWSTSALWFDYDNDGKLDLFVPKFVPPEKGTTCGMAPDGHRHYCIPKAFEPSASVLFHNNGDGTFTDVSEKAGLTKLRGKPWGAVATDINNDGWLDLWVANDTVPNFLLRNKGNGTFEEIGLEADVAYSADGKARSGMGVDSADFDDDGFMDLFVANIDEEIFALYRNTRDGMFTDLAMDTGLGMATRWLSGWGMRFVDYDNDGLLDLFLANGFPDDGVDERPSEITYKQPLVLFHNEGKSYHDVSKQAGPIFQQRFAARGMAIGDFDNDGLIDVVVGVNDAAPILLHNETKPASHWLGIKLVGTTSNRDAVGARVSYSIAGTVHRRMETSGGSFLSSHDRRMVLGAGPDKIDWVEIKWPGPSGKVERLTKLPADQYITITEGSNQWK
jgi:enediyne biosynthesis protein E4